MLLKCLSFVILINHPENGSIKYSICMTNDSLIFHIYQLPVNLFNSTNHCRSFSLPSSTSGRHSHLSLLICFIVYQNDQIQCRKKQNPQDLGGRKLGRHSNECGIWNYIIISSCFKGCCENQIFLFTCTANAKETNPYVIPLNC